jgi:outer membrane protein OmpA-like peptidoglycan-associated protein
LFVERPLANPNPKLSVTVAGLDTHAPPSPPAADGTTRKPGKVRTAAAAMQDLLGELRGMVERAREDGAGSTPPANGAGPTAPAQSGPADGRPSAPQQAPVSGTVNPSRPAAGNERRAIPIPIKFVYQEATFTEDGREAARLLLEYVRLRKLDTLELTGHADERGSPGFNMQLSSARLAAVARFLEQGGYKGKLILRPRGEAEPFQGVDRSLYRPEDLFELDRRVELRVRD